MPRSLLYSLGFAVVTVGILMFVLIGRNDRRQHDGAAATVDAMVVDTSSGPVLVVNDRGNRAREQFGRLVAVDARDGKRLATRVERGQLECDPARGGRLWCRLPRAVLVDARTLADVTDIATAITKAGLASPLPDQITLADDAAFATLADGRIARLDASSLAVTEVKTAGTGSAPPSSSCDLQTEQGELGFSEGTRRKVVIRGASPAPAAAELLNPRFLATDSRTRAPLGNADGVLVHHDSSLDASARTLLSRTDRAGTLRWTAELGGPCQIATIVDHALVVATTSGARRARSLDLATGTIRWQLQFD